jgi:hypothetical protein
MYDEEVACTPVPVRRESFNPKCILPYGLEVIHIYQSMVDFTEFLGVINQALYAKELPRLESFLMQANFSSIVGEFATSNIPRYCHALVKNGFHNGHPDLIPKGLFPGDSVQYATEGIEVKGSRRSGGWQGHNPESVWLIVFHFDSNTAVDKRNDIGPKPFRFRGVYAAKLEKEDWKFSGRLGESRRTITASVNQSGVARMKANWIYKE